MGVICRPYQVILSWLISGFSTTIEELIVKKYTKNNIYQDNAGTVNRLVRASHQLATWDFG
jgi:hypothetical protein